MKIAILLLLAALAPTAQAAEALGRIFYTPEQRAQLDSLRKQRAIVSQARDEPAPETVTYNGIVRRSDGKTVVWMNQQPLSDAELRSGQALAGRIGRDGRLTLQNPQDGNGPKLELKVGQSATLLSGKVDESFAQRPAPPAAAKPVPVKPAPAGEPATATSPGTPAESPRREGDSPQSVRERGSETPGK